MSTKVISMTATPPVNHHDNLIEFILINRKTHAHTWLPDGLSHTPPRVLVLGCFSIIVKTFLWSPFDPEPSIARVDGWCLYQNPTNKLLMKKRHQRFDQSANQYPQGKITVVSFEVVFIEQKACSACKMNSFEPKRLLMICFITVFAYFFPSSPSSPSLSFSFQSVDQFDRPSIEINRLSSISSECVWIILIRQICLISDDDIDVNVRFRSEAWMSRSLILCATFIPHFQARTGKWVRKRAFLHSTANSIFRCVRPLNAPPHQKSTD